MHEHIQAGPQACSQSSLDTVNLFPSLTLNQFGTAAGIIFMLGITSAAFSSADSALTSQTTAFYTDFLRLNHKTDAEKTRIRNRE